MHRLNWHVCKRVYYWCTHEVAPPSEQNTVFPPLFGYSAELIRFKQHKQMETPGRPVHISASDSVQRLPIKSNCSCFQVTGGTGTARRREEMTWTWHDVLLGCLGGWLVSAGCWFPSRTLVRWSMFLIISVHYYVILFIKSTLVFHDCEYIIQM